MSSPENLWPNFLINSAVFLIKPVIGIIGGKGKMGSYFVKFFEQNGYKVLVSDVGTNPGDKTVAKKADVVIVSVPSKMMEKVLSEVAPLVKKMGFLVALAPVKKGVMSQLKRTKASHLSFNALFESTDKMNGQTIILSPGRGKLWKLWLTNLFEKNGAVVSELSHEEHDKLIAHLQNLAYFYHVVFADTIRRSGISMKKFLKYASPLNRLEFYLMGRTFNRHPKYYSNNQLDNPTNLKVVETFLSSCRELAATIEKKKTSDNIAFFKKNAKHLGAFTQIATEESDRLLDQLKLNKAPSLFESSPKPKPNDIAILGPQNTYSHLALKRFGEEENPWFSSSIYDIFKLVVGGKVKAGLIPIENTTGGSVRATLDSLYEKNVHIDQLISLPIKLTLISDSKVSLKKIRVIYSHPQALMQARQFFEKHCPNASLISTSSTAAAVERMLSDNGKESAAVGSIAAAEAHKLKILKRSIQDNRENTTYFALIKKGPFKSNKQAKKVSIAFYFKKDSPGFLSHILQLFSESKINLTKIESRPNGKIQGEYIFFIDFEGNMTTKKVQATLKNIKAKVAKMKILGAY